MPKSQRLDFLGFRCLGVLASPLLLRCAVQMEYGMVALLVVSIGRRCRRRHLGVRVCFSLAPVPCRYWLSTLCRPLRYVAARVVGVV